MQTNPQELIDHSPMTAVQITVITMCILLNALDGFDVLSISFASPGIAQDWGIDRAALGLVLSMELIGMAFGSIILGRMADRFGRRPTILLCLAIMCVGMVLAGLAKGLVDLSFYRFFTGLGIGGMLASTNALVAEFASKKYRHMAVTFMAGGFPLGIIVGGSISGELLEVFNWRAIFYFGSIVTACFFVLTFFLLPESLAYLTHKQPKNSLQKINSILIKMRKPSLKELPNLFQENKLIKRSVSLFSPSLRTITILLTIAYFAHITTHYFFLKWVPKIVVDMGYEPSAAGGVLVWANVGGVVSSILMGLFSQKVSVKKLTIAMLLGCACSIYLFGSSVESLQSFIFAATLAGFFSQAAVVGLYALFAEFFPTEIRASGTGFVIGLGRGGAAAGPIVAGLLFSFGYGLQPVAAMMACGSFVAFAVLFLLRSSRANTVSDVVEG